MKKIKVLLSVLLAFGVLSVFSACGDGHEGEIPPMPTDYPSQPVDNPQGGGDEQGSTDPMTGYKYVGKKKPSEKKVAGDIVYYDGSATNILVDDGITVNIREYMLEEATTGDAEGHAVALIIYSDDTSALGVALGPQRTTWYNITNEMSENYPSEYYSTSDVVSSRVVPDALKSGWRLPTKADLEKAITNIEWLVDTLYYLTNGNFYGGSYYDTSIPNYESIWSSTEDGDKAYTLFYEKPNYMGNGSKKIILEDKATARNLFLPFHDF